MPDWTEAQLRALIADELGLRSIGAGAGSGVVANNGSNGTLNFDVALAVAFGLVSGTALEGSRYAEVAKLAGAEFTGPVLAPVPTSPGHLARLDTVQAAVAGTLNVTNATTVATAPVTLSGLQTIAGYTLQAGDLVLPTAQASASERRLYVAATGAWTPATADPWTDEPGLSVTITEGTEAESTWTLMSSADPFVPASSPRTWVYRGTPTDVSGTHPLLRVGSALQLLVKTASGLDVGVDGLELTGLVSDAQHGVRGALVGATPAHPLVTASDPGFMSSAMLAALLRTGGLFEWGGTVDVTVGIPGPVVPLANPIVYLGREGAATTTAQRRPLLSGAKVGRAVVVVTRNTFEHPIGLNLMRGDAGDGTSFPNPLVATGVGLEVPAEYVGVLPEWPAFDVALPSLATLDLAAVTYGTGGLTLQVLFEALQVI